MDEVTLAFLLLAAAVGVAMLLALTVTDGMMSPVSSRRAKELFLSKLSDGERRRWRRERRLTVVASSGRCYTLGPYESFNIRCGDEVYCLRVLGRVPGYDKLLAQRLLLESDERAFLTIANRRELRSC